MDLDQTDPKGAILSRCFAIFEMDEAKVSDWWEKG